MLSECAQVIPPIAAPFAPQTVARSTGECVEHIGRDSLIARAIERRLNALGVGRGLIPDRLETGHTLFQHRIIQIGQASFDGVVEAIEPLVGSPCLRWSGIETSCSAWRVVETRR